LAKGHPGKQDFFCAVFHPGQNCPKKKARANLPGFQFSTKPFYYEQIQLPEFILNDKIGKRSPNGSNFFYETHSISNYAITVSSSSIFT
jgi:hypothetical protein